MTDKQIEQLAIRYVPELVLDGILENADGLPFQDERRRTKLY